MQVHKYQGKTIDEAMAKVKSNLGPDAMIFSTRKIEGKTGNHQFEISAIPPGNAGKDAGSIGDIKSELMSIKEMIYLLNHSSGMAEYLLKDPEMVMLYSALIRNGVKDQHAKFLLNECGSMVDSTTGSRQNIRLNLTRSLMKTIQVKNPFTSNNGKRIIAAMIGTTGVGKTTTIAKLAAQLVLKAKKKVGLISIDNYRIGALEQLRIYANILGIPCFPAFNREDLLSALRRLGGSDVILIDTAGQSQYDMDRIMELNRMISDDDLAISTHLLLSVATTESAMRQTALNFSALKFESYIFTKIDEAETCGAMLNQVMSQNHPISFLTTGQNVPEDIEVADKKKIVKRLLTSNRAARP